jgi:hypothetical protein
MEQVLQILGALMILVAFGAAQFQRMATTSYAYLILNLVGSAILATLAALGRQWGFLLLEGAWAVVSLVSLVRKAWGKPTAAHP